MPHNEEWWENEYRKALDRDALREADERMNREEYGEGNRKAVFSGGPGNLDLILFENDHPLHKFNSVSWEKVSDAAKRWVVEGIAPRGLIRRPLSESDSER